MWTNPKRAISASTLSNSTDRRMECDRPCSSRSVRTMDARVDRDESDREMCAQGLGDGEDERSTPSHRSALAELPKGNINHIVTKERLNSSGITASTPLMASRCRRPHRSLMTTRTGSALTNPPHSRTRGIALSHRHRALTDSGISSCLPSSPDLGEMQRPTVGRRPFRSHPRDVEPSRHVPEKAPVARMPSATPIPLHRRQPVPTAPLPKGYTWSRPSTDSTRRRCHRRVGGVLSSHHPLDPIAPWTVVPRRIQSAARSLRREGRSLLLTSITSSHGVSPHG